MGTYSNSGIELQKVYSDLSIEHHQSKLALKFSITANMVK